jgi:aspartate/methionine/tyrosine aminotransferase
MTSRLDPSDLAVPPNHLTAREAVLCLRGLKIREVANASLGKSDVLAFWFGEPDELTPDFIRRAGIASLEAGETFGPEGEGFVRWCFASSKARLADGVERLAEALAR